MRILVIGDLHWLNVWKKLIKENSFDKVVFLWDYVDSFNFSDSEIIANLRNIIQFKKDNYEKVILLLWNHDIQYIYEWNNCSWRRESYALVIWNLFKENEELFQVAHQEGNYIFSHAWFTQDWLKHNWRIIDSWREYEWEAISPLVNKILKTKNKGKLFQCWNWRGGHAKYSWPLWADKSETKEAYDSDLWEWVVQVVWHSHVPKIRDLGHIIYCDVLEYWDWIPLLLNTEEYDDWTSIIKTWIEYKPEFIYK